MYCPMCGNKLQEVKVDMPDDDIDWEDPKQVDEYMALESKRHGAIDMTCTGDNKCFVKECPLTFHHPIYGIDHAPGDSWSLSWIK